MAFAAQDYYLVKVWRIMDHGNEADMPSADSPDRLWWAVDSKVLYRDTGSAWHRISSFDGHAYGNTFANRPAAGVVDRLFFATDELILYRDTGLAWEAIGVGGDHHGRHENGGADEINVAGLSGELADRQPVKLHAVQHVTGGDDVIANAIAAGNAGLMTGVDKTKLDGITAGANVVADANIGDHRLIRGDGGARKIQECSTITVDDTGRMINPAQPCFSIMLSEDSPIFTINNWYGLLFNSEIFDIGNNFWSNKFNASVAGKYLFTIKVRFYNIDTGATYYQIQILTSNRPYCFVVDPNYSADLNYFSYTATVIADMDLYDTAEIFVMQGDGAEQSSIALESRFMGVLLC